MNANTFWTDFNNTLDTVCELRATLDLHIGGIHLDNKARLGGVLDRCRDGMKNVRLAQTAAELKGNVTDEVKKLVKEILNDKP